VVKKLYLIGMGPGDPKYLTLEAVNLMKKLKLFFIPGKKGKKFELTRIRKDILSFVKGNDDYQVVEVLFPERRKSLNYEETVQEWRNQKAKILKEELQRHEEDEAGFLIWGDPSIYDGHIAIIKEVVKETGLEFEVIPGISAFQVLSAHHKEPFTDIGESLLFTTPRFIRKNKKIDLNTVVFLDNYESYNLLIDEDLEMFWGAYLGLKEEVLISGKLSEVRKKVTEIRRKLRKEKGWIMEVYFLKKVKR